MKKEKRKMNWIDDRTKKGEIGQDKRSGVKMS